MAIHHINPTSRELPVSHSVQCHSALCLQSGHTQQHVHFAMTVFTSAIHKPSLPQALLTKQEASADTQNLDWLALSCYIQRCCVVCTSFAIFRFYSKVHCSVFKSKFFSMNMQFVQPDFLSTVPDLSDEDTTLKVGIKCSREDTNATISALL